MVKHRRLFPPVTGSKVFDRSVSIVFWLLMISFVLAILNEFFVGGSTSSGAFGFDGPYIHYQVRTGRIRADRLEHAVIAEVFPKDQRYDGKTYTFLFVGQGTVTVRPKRGETLWVDEDGNVTTLGPALSAADIAILKSLRSNAISPISSPEELLALVASLRAGPLTLEP